MAIQFSVAVRNARGDSLEIAVGPSAVLKLRTGAPPANIAAADSGIVLATINLPSDWMMASSDGVKNKSGTWECTSPENAGNAAHFRIYEIDGVTPHVQGTVSAENGSGDMWIDAIAIVLARGVRVLSFILTEGNA